MAHLTAVGVYFKLVGVLQLLVSVPVVYLCLDSLSLYLQSYCPYCSSQQFCRSLQCLLSLDVLLTDNCLTDVIKSSPLTLDGFLIFERSLFFVIPAGLRFASLMYFFVVLVPLFSRGFVTECTWFRYVPLRWTLINVLKCSWTYLVGGCVPWTLLSLVDYSLYSDLWNHSSYNKGC